MTCVDTVHTPPSIKFGVAHVGVVLATVTVLVFGVLPSMIGVTFAAVVPFILLGSPLSPYRRTRPPLSNMLTDVGAILVSAVAIASELVPVAVGAAVIGVAHLSLLSTVRKAASPAREYGAKQLHDEPVSVLGREVSGVSLVPDPVDATHWRMRRVAHLN